MDEEKKAELEQRLTEVKKIYGTIYGYPYKKNGTESESTIIEIEGFKILKGNYNTTGIYYEWWAPDRYNLYNLEDYGITWGFTEEEIIGHTQKTIEEISKLSSLQKLELILKENAKENERDIAIDLLKQDLTNK